MKSIYSPSGKDLFIDKIIEMEMESEWKKKYERNIRLHYQW